MAKVIFLNTQIGGIETLPAAVGDGRTLGLNPTQFDTLKKNASTQIVEFSSKAQESAPQAPVESITPEPEVVQAPVTPVAPVTPEAPVMPEIAPNVGVTGPTENTITEVVQPVEPTPVIPEPVAVEPQVVTPVIPDVTPVSVTSEIPAVDTTAPVMSDVAPSVGVAEVQENAAPEVVSPVEPTPVTPVIPEPVIQEEAPAPLPGQVEIVSNNPDNTDYDKLMTQIADINANYDKQIAELNQKRTEEIKQALEENKNKIVDYEAKIKDLQGRAEEHLKNAQAAETIATIAQANAQKTQG